MSDSDSNPPRHNERWSADQKRKVISLRRSGKKYDEIAGTMGRTKHAVKSMCERLERAQYSDNEHNNQWNARLLKINAPLIKKQTTADNVSISQKQSKQSDEVYTANKPSNNAHNNYNTDSDDDDEENNNKEIQKTQETQQTPQETRQTSQDTKQDTYNYTDYSDSTHSIPFGVGYPQQTTDDLLYEEHGFSASHLAPFEANTTYSNNNELQYPLSINQIPETQTKSTATVTTTQQQIPWPANHANQGANTDDTKTEKEEEHDINTDTKQTEKMDKNDNVQNNEKDVNDIEKQTEGVNEKKDMNDNDDDSKHNPDKEVKEVEIEKNKSTEDNNDKNNTNNSNDTSNNTNNGNDMNATNDTDVSKEANTEPIHKENTKDKNECKDKMDNIMDTIIDGNKNIDNDKITDKTKTVNKKEEQIETDGNESDNDCIIISVSNAKTSAMNKSKSVPPKRNGFKNKPSAVVRDSNQRAQRNKSIGNQGSDVEYRRLIQKYGQSMRYAEDEIVTFFVPRLAQKGRFKDRIGKIQCKLMDSQYQIVDQQNNKQEIVPWKWILKAPPNIKITKRKRNTNEKELMETQQRKKHKPDRIPMDSLKTREEKLAEFNRRMNNKKQIKYKQYSVPIHASYYDDYDDYTPRYTRGRSVHNEHRSFHNNNNGYSRFNVQRLRSPPPKKHYHDYDDRYYHNKKKQIRSYSVFPQRMPRRRLHSPLPPLQSDDDKVSLHKRKRDVIDIADDDDDIEIKPEKEETDKNNKDYHRKRSRSRSPSHIRPSNRIINNNNTSSTHRGDYCNRYAPHSSPHLNGYYDGVDHGRYHNKLTKSGSSHHRYYRDYHISLSHHQAKRSPSRSRSRERDRNRDRDGNNGYWRPCYHDRHPHNVYPAHPPYNDYYRSRRDHRDDRDRGDYREHRDHRDSYYYNQPMHMIYSDDRYYRNERRDRRDRIGIETKNDTSLLMQRWLHVTSRMRGGSKLGQREIDYLCQSDVYPEQIKQFMDSDKQIQEKYDMVAHYVDPTNGQNLTRSQVYSIIGAVITMKF